MSDYEGLRSSFGGSRWGALRQGELPASEDVVDETIEQLEDAASKDFALFDDEAGHQESRIRRVARSRAFQRIVRRSYYDECAICKLGLRHPDGRSELEAGHIVSRSLKGSDDIRNGLLFCKCHHWAFDAGLMGLNDDYTILVPDVVAQIDQNSSLVSFADQMISLPDSDHHLPSFEALAWHREHILVS